jgi:hypothetical protein
MSQQEMVFGNVSLQFVQLAGDGPLFLLRFARDAEIANYG